jgi:hypothetical protein
MVKWGCIIVTSIVRSLIMMDARGILMSLERASKWNLIVCKGLPSHPSFLSFIKITTKRTQQNKHPLVLSFSDVIYEKWNLIDFSVSHKKKRALHCGTLRLCIRLRFKQFSILNKWKTFFYLSSVHDTELAFSCSMTSDVKIFLRQVLLWYW